MAQPRRKKNSYDASAEQYERFHGHPSTGVSKVTTLVHEHDNLAEIGELQKLVILTTDGDEVELSGFDDAILSTNEDGTQLYIEGGDQQLDLDVFGIEKVHESEVLGEAIRIEYFTTKDHLGDQGGEATYHHDFGENDGEGPMVVYDTRNCLISFAGGSYEILAEGIEN